MSETTELLSKLDTLSRSAKLGAKDAQRIGNDEMLAWHLEREAATMDAAKAEISRLTARVEELERALKPFAECAEQLERFDYGGTDIPISSMARSKVRITVNDLARARTTLEASDRNGGKQ